jgi:flavin-dependent dehydrogenase
VVDLLNEQQHIYCPGSISIWGQEQPGFNDFFYTPVGKGYHLDRDTFNQSLMLAAESSGARLMRDTKLSSIEQTEETKQLKLTLETADDTIIKYADFVIDATGIQAKVARSLGVARNQYDAVISACAIYPLDAQTSKAAYTLVNAVENGWWYGTQLPNNKALISFCSDTETLKKTNASDPKYWYQLLLTSDWFYQSCCDQFDTKLQQPTDIDLRLAPSAILSCVIGNNWLAVGDAASSYDSITSAGITKALQQGLAAGNAIVQLLTENNEDALKTYQQDIFNAFNEYLKLHQTLYHTEQRFSESQFWQRRQFKEMYSG